MTVKDYLAMLENGIDLVAIHKIHTDRKKLINCSICVEETRKRQAIATN